MCRGRFTITRVRRSTVATHATSWPAYPPPPRSTAGWGAGDQCRQDLFGPIAVLHPSRMDEDDEEQPQDIDHDVARAPPDALAAVIAPEPPFSVVFTV